MSLDPAALDADVLAFLADRQLASLTTQRADGSPHVCAVGFTWDKDNGVARIITSRESVKARNAARGGRAALCQVAWGGWITLEGPIQVASEPHEVAEAVRRYGERYRQPEPNPLRVALVITVDRVLGGVSSAAAISARAPSPHGAQR